ncbi:fungal specific transcription factor domain-containing protein [Diaporthe amygdali]|uniref:fungal specific transcription factor domain-containing protein n=1 Tax=Phomopsis amygdali TaxID=1214568 RepID=UPI0022FDBDB2|nr:fungal specific transcription factor domain-containing protein [Diaporthe amygdali]KAJ0116312.1 fungal specific transcription factor domain-containing protein [Diaporthe amygdali]
MVSSKQNIPLQGDKQPSVAFGTSPLSDAQILRNSLEGLNEDHFASILAHAVELTEKASSTSGCNNHHKGPKIFDQDNRTAGLDFGFLQINPDDAKYLLGKGAFTLPPQNCLTSLIFVYFEYIHPYAPVLNRLEFMKAYQGGNYSIFLVQTILAAASLHASLPILSACGFQQRAEAQAAFCSRAILLYDFQYEKNEMTLLYGSTILASITFFQPANKDWQYWLYNAVRLMAKMGFQKSFKCTPQDMVDYLLEDLEGEDSVDDLALLGLNPLSHQQKSYLTEHAKLAQIGD